MKYLSEMMENFPKNVILSKGITGCGATTLALTNKIPYVIAVPFTSIITNKISQYKSGTILGVMAGTTTAEIEEYLQNTDIPKIMCTYDKLSFVTETVNPSYFDLLIDEYHLLLTQYCFRDKAINGVLNSFKKYNQYCFISATPIERDMVLKELEDIPIKQIDWGKELTKVNVNVLKCSNVKASTIRLIKLFLDGQIDGYAFLFCNSVRFIKEIVKECELTDENCRVVYSKANKTIMSIPNGETTDPYKKINFFTSTVFEGADLYCKEGKIFIISDPNYENSLIDISTSVRQIAGRIRDSKYSNTIYHLYKTTRYQELTYDEFVELQKETERKARKFEEDTKKNDEECRAAMSIDCKYLIKTEDNRFVFEPNLMKMDTWNYRILNNYSINVQLDDVYKQNNMDSNIQRDYTLMKDLIINKPEKKGFELCVREIRSTEFFVSRELLIQKYTQDYPFLRDAIEKLGFETIDTLRYVPKRIKEELNRREDNTVAIKVFKQLKFKPGEFIVAGDVKKKIIKAYETLGFKHKATSDEIEQFYDVTYKSKRVDGKVVKGYDIVRSKFNLK